MSARPFLFDRTFDVFDDDGPDTAAPAKTYDEAALEAERQAAFAEGFAAGQAEATAAAEAAATARATDARAAIADALPAALAQAEAAEAAVLVAAPTATAKALRAAFPVFAAGHGGAEILAAVRDAISRAADEPRLVVRLAASDFDAIEPELAEIAASAGFAGRIVSLEDAALASGDVRLEWADGGLARDQARLAETIADALLDLARSGVAPTAALAPDATAPSESTPAEPTQAGD